MPDQPSLFDDGDKAATHPLTNAAKALERRLAGIESAINANTHAINDLATAVLRVLDERGITGGPAADQEHADGAPTEAAEEPADEPVPAETEGEEPAAAAEPEGGTDARERKPVERSARWSELAGFDAAAVVGPGWVQIGAKRWAFEVRSAAEIVRIAGALKHSRSAPQVWVLTEVCEELNLVAYPDDVNRSRSERITSLERNLAELPAAADFLAPVLDDGWTCNGRLEPWTLLRGPKGKLVHLVLEPYTWMYDYRGRGVIADGGDDDREYPNAIDGEPEDRADEILRRVRWISDLLGVLPDSNPGRTVQRMVEVDRRKRLRAIERGDTPQVDKAGRHLARVVTEPGRIPEMDGDAELGLDAVAPELVWSRIPSREEIDTAEVLVEMDQRYAYLATLSNTVFGVGDPKWVSAEEAARTIAEGKPWFGVVRCQPRAKWHEPRMFPPHPAMDGRRPWPHWYMAPTIDIAHDDEDQGGAGWSLEDFGITGAYLWPDCGRLMEPFYKNMRKALLTAEEIEDPALRAATIEHLKAGYKSLTGKWEDVAILNSGHRTYRYQPMYRRQTIAATAARLFRQVRRLEMRFRGLWPVHAVTDGAWYLTTRSIADVLIEEGKSAKFGQLRPKRVHELTDANRAALRAMSPDDKIISVPHVLLGTRG